MPYNAIETTEIQVGKPVKQSLLQKVKDNFDYLIGLNVSNITADVQNGSFEIDSDSDGIPDGWTRSLYPGGSGVFETTNPAHGAKAYKFIHPGGAGNGGGYLESDYIAYSIVASKNLSLAYYTTAATCGVSVLILYYNAEKVLISSMYLYDSAVSQPNKWSLLYIHSIPAPATAAQFCKIRLYGGHSSYPTAGTIYFDNVEFVQAEPARTPSLVAGINQSEVSTNSANWVDVGSSWSITIPTWAAALHVMTTLSHSPDPNFNYSVFGRFRIGTAYSSECSLPSSGNGGPETFNLSLLNVPTGAQTLQFQAKSGYSSDPARISSPTANIKYAICFKRVYNALFNTTTDW